MNLLSAGRFYQIADAPLHEVIDHTDIFQKHAQFFGEKYGKFLELLGFCISAGIKDSQTLFEDFFEEFSQEGHKLGVPEEIGRIFSLFESLPNHRSTRNNADIFSEYLSPHLEGVLIVDIFQEVKSDQYFGIPIFTLTPFLYESLLSSLGKNLKISFPDSASYLYVNDENPSDHFIVLRGDQDKPLLHELSHFLFFLIRSSGSYSYKKEDELFYTLLDESLASIIGDQDAFPDLNQIFPTRSLDEIPPNIYESWHNLELSWFILNNRTDGRNDSLAYALSFSRNIEELKDYLAALCLDVHPLMPHEEDTVHTTRSLALHDSGRIGNPFLDEVFLTRIHVLECLRFIKKGKSVNLNILDRKYPGIFCFLMWQVSHKMKVDLPIPLKNAIVQRILQYPYVHEQEQIFLKQNWNSQEIRDMYQYLIMNGLDG